MIPDVRERMLCDDGGVVFLERLPRTARSSDRVLTGAAAGLAQRWNVDPTVVRAALTVLGLVGGIGIALYGVAVLVSEPSDDASAHPVEAPSADPRRALAVASGTGAVLVLSRAIGLWAGDGIMLAAIATGVGVTIVWASDGPDADPRWYRHAAIRRIARPVVGAVLLGAGVISLANRTGGLSNVGASASAIAVVIGGIAAFGAPALGRTLSALDDERANHIREDEMARVSAHLHDSVLQSLVLIQRSHDPREMTTLARRQERELRAWLYGDVSPGEPTTVAAAVEVMATAIESDHRVRVEAVVVGDQPLDDVAVTLVAALREAVVNAARHADVERIDVFVEADVAELTGFVRDTGRGFDPARVVDGHRGIEDSIVGRIRRAGGTSVVDSHPGHGTEIEIRLPRLRTNRMGS